MASNDAIEAREEAQFKREVARLEALKYTDWLLSETDFRAYTPMSFANTATEKYQWTRTVKNVHYYDVFTRKLREGNEQ